MEARAVVSFTDAELASAVDVLRAVAADGPSPRLRCRRKPVRQQLRSLATGQFLKHRAVDPHGNTLPAGVTWFGGVEPGYRVTVRWRGREASLVVAYRTHPGCAGIRKAQELKALLATIRDTVPPACMPAFAAAVATLAEEAGGGCCCGDSSVGRGCR